MLRGDADPSAQQGTCISRTFSLERLSWRYRSCGEQSFEDRPTKLACGDRKLALVPIALTSLLLLSMAFLMPNSRLGSRRYTRAFPRQEYFQRDCGIFDHGVEYQASSNTSSSLVVARLQPIWSEHICASLCDGRTECGAWVWRNKSAAEASLVHVCFLLRTDIVNQGIVKAQGVGIVSGVPPRVTYPESSCIGRSYGNNEYIEQDGAEFSVGADVRIYAVGSSSVLWMTWLDQVHLYLLMLGYGVPLVPAELKQASTWARKRVQTCEDSMYFNRLRTAMLARVGWCSWDFGFEGWEDCNDSGYRNISGYSVKCQHGPGCSYSHRPLFSSQIAVDAGNSNLTLVSNWFNDDQQGWSHFKCFGGKSLTSTDALDLTIPSILNLVRAIHARNPHVWVLILGKYPQTPGHVSTPLYKALNARVKRAVEEEPRTLFVDYWIPSDDVAHMYQFGAHHGHPNCRGSKVIAHAILEKLFHAKVLARSLRNSNATKEYLANASCKELEVVDCEQSPVCWVDPASEQCIPYGPGTFTLHSPLAASQE